jgi:hypothetical protein
MKNRWHALRSFASFAPTSLSRADSYCAKLAKRLGFGVVSKERRPYNVMEIIDDHQHSNIKLRC